jgi:hypothetical protein
MVKNYIINFFKSIVVVDFLTLNKKAVLFLIVLVSFAGIVNYLNFLLDWLKFNDPVQNIIFSLAIGNTVSAVCFGLIIPLLVRSWFSYIILWFGFLNVFGVIEAFIGEFTIISSNLSRLVMWILSLVGCILYAQLIKYLRKKYLTNTGRN